MSETKQVDPEGRARILIVDDEQAIRELVLDVLAVDGYELHQADDGPAAQAVLARATIDVVITDLRMPRMTGLELMRWAQENHPGSAWIILSGRGTFGDAVRAVQLGAFDFICKPTELAESLPVAVRNALRQRRLAAEKQRLLRDLADRNEQLARQVDQLQEACSLLCEQAETIAQDLRRAELIQRALLPTVPPSMGEFSVDAVYRPSHNVGGDLYEVLRVNDRYVIAYIADAAGHGVAAAMLAVLFKHRIGALDDHRNPRAPADVLASVNGALLAECGAPGLFITAAYCLLDMDSRQVVAASAGHTPMVLHRAGGGIEMIYHTGPALGLAPEARFAQKRFLFEPGDRLLLYTDGLYDAPQQGAALTADRVADIVRDRPAGDGRELLGHLLGAAADRRGGTRREDDITMVLLKARPSPSTLDNAGPTADQAPQALRPSPRVQVLLGRGDRSAAFSIEGRATWEYCAGFHDACAAEIDAARAVTLDLSLCVYLDSTFLGTIQELVTRARRADGAFRIQGVLPDVRRLFEELGMGAVVEHIAPEMLPLPGRMSPLGSSGDEGNGNRRRILRAHEALASLSDRNREEFIRIIEYVRRELPPAPASP